MIIFPPRYEPNLYDNLTGLKENVNLKKIRSFIFPNKPIYGKPLIILQDNHIMIAPELNKKEKNPPEVLQFKANEDKPKILHKISDEEFERLGKKPGTIVHHIKL